MDVENRYVTFGNKLKQKVQEKKPGYIATKEGIRWALDAAGNTGQYIRYVNMKIDKHQQQINHIKDLHEKFDSEIELLQSENLEKIHLDKNNPSHLDVKEITRSLDQLLLGKRNTKTRLRTLESELAIAEKELEQQERQIEDVRENLKKTGYTGKSTYGVSNELSTLKIIKAELHNLGKENDVSKLSHAIDILASSLE
jgi:chromosome segregation ATPase